MILQFPRWRASLRTVASALLLVLGLASPPAALAQERLVRHFGVEDGLASATVFSLAQDSTGFLWIGTASGLYRYDGVEMRRWAPERLRGRIQAVVVLSSGRRVALEEAGPLWWVEETGARRIEVPRGSGGRDVIDVAPGPDGSFWAVGGGGELWRRGDGGWSEIDPGPKVRAESPRRISPGASGALDVATTDAVWTLPPDGEPRRLADVSGVVTTLALQDGGRYILTFDGALHLLRDGGLRRVLEVEGRGVDLAARGDAVWVTFDRYLARLRPDRPPEIVGPSDALGSGGPLLVDAERSLWMGSYTGLLQFPEPATLLWSETHGLPSAHTRFVARTGDTTWVSTWQGLGAVVPGPSGFEARNLDTLFVSSRLAVDADGDLWADTPDGLAEFRTGREPIPRHPDLGPLVSADHGRHGGLWIGTEGGLYRVEAGGVTPSGGAEIRRARGLAVEEDESVTAVLHEARDDAPDRIWATAGERICRVAADSAISATAPSWRCWSIPGAVHFGALHRTAAGSMWAASPYLGVLRLQGARWEPVPGSEGLPSRSVLDLVPSPSGGVWLLGHGILRRVVAEPSAPDGWWVVERLSSWHGLPGPGGRDLLEEPDGTIWVTTSRGLARVPGSVRTRDHSPPPVTLVEARVDGEPLPPDRVAELPHDRNRIELRFAALSYRDPSAVRYQVRLHPDSRWSETRLQPRIQWVDLRPGRYGAEVRASLDGVTWSPAVALLDFEVLPPWYLEPGSIAVFLLLAILGALLAYRSRVNHLVELERQRTRIAMDLHDELGGALGSIGIQAGLLRGSASAGSHARRIAGRIGETAEEVGTKLTDLVWSLDPRPATLEQLARRLEKRGRELSADRDLDLRIRRPAAWPDRELPAAVRRNVLLVGVEALQNAVTHAGADEILLSLAPAEPGRWRLSVRDDGRGLPPAAERDATGLGLLSLRRRADEIDATIRWERPAEGGTEVILLFPLRGRRSALERIRAGAGRLLDRMNMRLRAR
ncbi:MAG: two-component regulator propeller domain-containing protein [Gemmatimonadota bacterium]